MTFACMISSFVWDACLLLSKILGGNGLCGFMTMICIGRLMYCPEILLGFWHIGGFMMARVRQWCALGR